MISGHVDINVSFSQIKNIYLEQPIETKSVQSVNEDMKYNAYFRILSVKHITAALAKKLFGKVKF